MPRTHLPYPPEFRHQMVELARSGRAIRALAREFECSDRTIGNRVRQGDLDEGRRDDGLTNAEREELRRVRGENRRLREEREILAKAAARVRSGGRLGAREAFELMRANPARSRIATMARVLGVCPSGLPAWRAREPSRRQQGDEALKARIGPIDQRSRGTYGAPRIHAELAADGVRVGC